MTTIDDADKHCTNPPPPDRVAALAKLYEMGLDFYTGEPLQGQDKLVSESLRGVRPKQAKRVAPSNDAAARFAAFARGAGIRVESI